MTHHDIDTVTSVTTAHKVSVGLLVATATLVLVSAAAAAVYTLVSNSQTSSVVVETPGTASAPVELDPSADRVLSTTP